MVDRGADAIARLTKRDVEALLRDYDTDPVAALTLALRTVLGTPGASWPELLQRAAMTETRRAALMVGEQRTLDALAAELNERRTL